MVCVVDSVSPVLRVMCVALVVWPVMCTVLVVWNLYGRFVAMWWVL